MKTIFAGAIAGVLLALAAYAALVMLFVIDTPGLKHRMLFAARVVVVFGFAFSASGTPFE